MASSSPSPASNMTYAQALTDARSLIVQQSTRIKADAAKIKQQADEIAQWKSLADDMAAELERLKGIEPKLAESQAAREQAEVTVGRQRMEIEALEAASRELQRILGDQAARINDLTSELEQTRDALPTNEDEAALEAMQSLLSAARKPRQARSDQPAPAPSPHEDADVIERRADRMVIPADATPFSQVAERQAA